MVKLGSRPIGVAEAVLGEINFLRPQQGRVKAGSSSSPKRGFSFSTRASQLWRFSLGSSAAILKKIGYGAVVDHSELTISDAEPTKTIATTTHMACRKSMMPKNQVIATPTSASVAIALPRFPVRAVVIDVMKDVIGFRLMDCA